MFTFSGENYITTDIKMKIKELNYGDLVDNILLVKDKRLNIAKNGSPYLSIKFVDNTGEIDAKLWDEADTYNNAFKKMTLSG